MSCCPQELWWGIEVLVLTVRQITMTIPLICCLLPCCLTLTSLIQMMMMMSRLISCLYARCGFPHARGQEQDAVLIAWRMTVLLTRKIMGGMRGPRLNCILRVDGLLFPERKDPGYRGPLVQRGVWVCQRWPDGISLVPGRCAVLVGKLIVMPRRVVSIVMNSLT